MAVPGFPIRRSRYPGGAEAWDEILACPLEIRFTQDSRMVGWWHTPACNSLLPAMICRGARTRSIPSSTAAVPSSTSCRRSVRWATRMVPVIWYHPLRPFTAWGLFFKGGDLGVASIACGFFESGCLTVNELYMIFYDVVSLRSVMNQYQYYQDWEFAPLKKLTFRNAWNLCNISMPSWHMVRKAPGLKDANKNRIRADHTIYQIYDS